MKNTEENTMINISLSYTIICAFFVIPTCVLSVDERHKHCSPLFKCGNHTELYYPFWTADKQECGHPDFKVNCSGDLAEFSISSVKFQILEMNYESRIIRLARKDYLNNLCPEDSGSAPINQDVLPFYKDTELLTLLYDCPVPSVDYLPGDHIGQLPCGDDTDEKIYFMRKEISSSQELVGANEFRSSCKKTIEIPVSRSDLKTAEITQSPETVKKALGKGFEVRFNNDCSRCVNSKGSCGYNQHSREFVCYCINEPHKHTCGKGLSKNAKIGIGFACGFLGAILIVGCLLCIFIRRRKKRADQYTNKGISTGTSYSSNTMSNTPTSTTISGSNHSLVPSMSNLANSVYFGVQVFSYEELEEATENFSKELGDGGFGTVYYGTLKDGRAVAVKRLFERSLKRVEQFKNEIEILKSLKHPNLVILYGCTTRHSRELLLVYEYISNGTLAEHLHGNQAQSRPLLWPTRLQIAIETASALSFLHTKGIIHRDVKTTNILLDSNYEVKVADFGLSRLFPTDQTHISTAPQGTPGYVDPEYYQCYRLNEKSDVYSFGVVLTELISSKEAVDITRHRHDINLANMAISKIRNDAVHELADLSLGFERDASVKNAMTSVAELAFRCLQQEREVRPSMDEIVEVLKGIQKEGIRDSKDVVVEIDVNGGGDEVGLLKHGVVPPPLSPETDKMTASSSNTTASSF
ncbi:PREDICTED: LEAF RUST 10 DISEASE-RESISTANCE LOCUS RECEPTOR-LIKE PROTEIN KINASE-like 1.3 isoform X1 [Camelina sativa]|uniref:non-specific serine/threonine protein kinase n=1 Tax=Camelina sativa TaxID=90675 RepID=A0ABM1QSC8_CAMSA|nr:PREDICTED: LEAF RUST 10 DISEASE-RESISTANCE LOCUS RECEPTOR-LIKE PROTEIN KINASE-like 1.3 isoform X1 [Camelina sativa]